MVAIMAGTVLLLFCRRLFWLAVAILGFLVARYHEGDSAAIRERRLVPMPELPRPGTPLPFPPHTNLKPPDLLIGIMNHYLYAVLHEILYSAMLAENQQRLAHMDRAMRHLDERIAQLKLRYNRLRQEEITEEIEVILLGAEAVEPDDSARSGGRQGL
jgi:F-type H+-transporting ATPase subunit gamma